MNNTDTSKAARASIKNRLTDLRAMVLDALRACRDGLTSEELTDLTGETYANIQPRTSELRRDGRIKDSGLRRMNRNSGKKTIVWTLA